MTGRECGGDARRLATSTRNGGTITKSRVRVSRRKEIIKIRAELMT